MMRSMKMMMMIKVVLVHRYGYADCGNGDDDRSNKRKYIGLPAVISH